MRNIVFTYDSTRLFIRSTSSKRYSRICVGMRFAIRVRHGTVRYVLPVS